MSNGPTGTSPAGLTRGSIIFVRPFLRRGWIAGSSPAMTTDGSVSMAIVTLPSRRQQRAEAAGHDARADARRRVDQALPREPCLEFRRRAALQEGAHGEAVVARSALIGEHD